MSKLAKSGAIAFGLWGALHIVGGATILAATTFSGPEAGYAFYSLDAASLPEATGAILAYFSYLLIISGVAAAIIAWRFNWQNSEPGLAANTALILAVEFGLILFLLVPGHLSVTDALPGFILFAAAAILGGIACRKEPSHVA